MPTPKASDLPYIASLPTSVWAALFSNLNHQAAILMSRHPGKIIMHIFHIPLARLPQLQVWKPPDHRRNCGIQLGVRQVLCNARP